MRCACVPHHGSGSNASTVKFPLARTHTILVAQILQNAGSGHRIAETQKAVTGVAPSKPCKGLREYLTGPSLARCSAPRPIPVAPMQSSAPPAENLSHIRSWRNQSKRFAMSFLLIHSSYNQVW
jgi:hypothetical protein